MILHAGLLWMAMGGVLSSLLSMVHVGGSVILSTVLLGTGVLAMVMASRRFMEGDEPPVEKSPAEKMVEHVAFALIFFLSGLSFYQILYETHGAYWTANGNNIGDLPMHI